MEEVFIPIDGSAKPVGRMREAEEMRDGLIGKDDLHVGGDVWRGAEEGLEEHDKGR